MRIKIYLFILLTSFLLLGNTSCIKNMVIGQPLMATVDASATNISVSNSFPVQLTIISAMPPNGIKVTTTVMSETDSTVITPQAPTYSTSEPTSSINIINLPQQKWCIATIKIIEINNISNTISKSFRVIYK